jgi:protein-S-isoprenylcysteine O-methyltransferase Ste14
MTRTRAVFSGAILLYFIICLEILIMISPFAGFFYSAFNPFLLGLAKYPATRWLSSFFFVHLLVPPDDFLKFVRIMGSVLFMAGLTAFLVCAFQVYASKFLKTGPALKGLYSVIRHPQYLSLAVAGAGLAIMWPRFLVVVLWIAMVFVYYLLAKDEERRMRKQFPVPYQQYMDRSGMFLPKRMERILGFSTAAGRLVLFVVLSAAALGGAFLLRDYTITHLPLWTEGNVAVLPISSGDEPMLQHRMGDILQLEEVKSRLRGNQAYLVYFLPQDYVMQGLIGDTGGDWQLYKQHHAMSMITDFVIHPFGHLAGGHHAMHYGGAAAAEHNMGSTTVRRLIFVRIPNETADKPSHLFALNAIRIPDFMVDVDVHALRVLAAKNLPVETAWGKVPTPVF